MKKPLGSLEVPCSVRIVVLVAPAVPSLTVVSGEDQVLVVVILVVVLWSLVVVKWLPPINSGALDEGIASIVVPIFAVDEGIISAVVPISVDDNDDALVVVPLSDSDIIVVVESDVLDGDPVVVLDVGSISLVEALGGSGVVPAHSSSAFSSVVKHSTAMASPHVLSVLSITFAHAAMLSSAPLQLIPYVLVLEDCWVV